MEEFKLDYEYEERESINEIMDYIYLEIKHQMH